MPKVTVYLPTKNRVDLLKRAIESVFAQTETDWELIVVDDASTDSTSDYLAEVSAQDERVRVLVNDESRGSCHSRNRAVKLAKSKLVTGLDDDDEFLPQRLEILLNAYEPKYAFVSTSLYWVTHSGSRMILDGEQILTRKSELSRNHAGNQILVERERLLAVGGFDEAFPSLQDYDCFYRLVERFGPARRVNTPTMNIYVSHGFERISSGPKSTEGYEKFAEKHGYKMNWLQKLNHSTQRAIRQGRQRSPIVALKLVLLNVLITGRRSEH
ncbi:glycosyltransferase [Pseudidiomarina aestuarii]|uniref:glycosyltransferase n=1 Tax=Pseudidiomarina aestuarii TaxID=624146 RepID=UPI003A987DCB